ncbi:flagellar biosynthesis anti-sigma factor FlgM [Heyndrickxia sporothermodurans]|uniref:Negative regulator of flagellin synthesis n=1 Tax=Heyndrickxia sporothermodurans TaxID=46224 RepID=A0A150LA66_9BACI|nr:flagellar biosynthesis anti-sigma factor FlgM [Heyndrickxia sporothermodurans]KYD09164.1 hypothetical protein B4102_2691 [Heyndrickxia sporothermodurans]MBL5768084.1 flagellar biosynthesis anti-sigma factor FlgM [Heyndrickxia sporothermodurans]MBL5771694.1 flagellar biosynthesis anti-sigma factor FlgM [Heyndrickxia sporothermodurans]MBL5775322.1 flagellar biosynthesis anti-sigma factor FlgM [Heyndrickxia sporothermodurans]MBL5778811.1 flagellar biosynthesis anti-sigma factor FlgM [Heyndrick
MKINNIGNHGINPYKKQMNKMEQVNKSGKQVDKVEISGAAKEMQQLSSIEKERQAKVEQLKKQVENGQYKIDPEKISTSIMKYYRP